MDRKRETVFCTDLDNTLIYSYKHDLGNNKINVEIYKEKEITFVSARTRELLLQVAEEVLLVPVTTRTVEQYERIHLGIDTPEYALTCNGGVLLVRGIREEDWYRESLSLIAPCRSELEKGIALLEGDPARSLEVRFIEALFVFTKSDAPEKTLEILRGELDEEKVDLYAQGSKIYVVPKILNKGTAVERLKSYLTGKGTEELYVIAAGDSCFDLPMMAAADLGLAPAALTFGETWECVEGKNDRKGRIVRMSGENLFSEELLEYILRFNDSGF